MYSTAGTVHVLIRSNTLQLDRTIRIPGRAVFVSYTIVLLLTILVISECCCLCTLTYVLYPVRTGMYAQVATMLPRCCTTMSQHGMIGVRDSGQTSGDLLA